MKNGLKNEMFGTLEPDYKVLDCGLRGSEFGHQARCYVHFWSNTLGDSVNPLFPPLSVMGKIVPLLSFFNSLVLNNPRRLACHSTKKPRQNQTSTNIIFRLIELVWFGFFVLMAYQPRLFIFTNLSARAGYDTRSIFADFNRFEFRFFLLVD